jgi:hypothetical protein
MNPMCNLVAERVALGETLGDLADHATTCERCRRTLALPSSLALTARAADPGMGFASRVTAGAQHRIAVRRRQRAAALGFVVAAGVVAIVVLFVRPSTESDPVALPASVVAGLPSINPITAKSDPWMPRVAPAVDPDVRSLVHLANTDRSLHLSARWDRLEQAVTPYGAVLRGTEP